MVLEKYGHGGDLLTAEKLFGVEQKDFIDFSANINPLGPPKKMIDAVKNNFGRIIHYPDPAHRTLINKLASKIAVDPDQIIIGNGAAECMALCILALRPRNVGVVYPCFSEYEQLARAFDANVVACYGEPENNYKPNIFELDTLVQQADLVFLGHPNNPTGVLYTHEELMMIARQAEITNTFLVIDEAFIDFVPNQTFLGELNQFPHLIIIRSMTKFFAIPGLRLGYAVASKELIHKMKQKQVTWSVTQLALIAGEACLEEQEYEHETIKLVNEQKNYLRRSIENFGWTVFPGEANFLLVRLPKSILVEDLQLEIGRKGIVIRSCQMYPGLTAQDFRIAVRNKNENDRLLRTLKEFIDVRSGK
jgi:threonine-phosphate decarboxylase